jgi:hypothetical protein
MFKRPLEFLQMKPIQMSMKALAAETIYATSMYAYNTIKKKVLGPEDTTLLILKKEALSSLEDLDYIWAHDTTWIELLGRLVIFRNFSRSTFDDIIHSIRIALEKTDSLSTTAIASFRIRSYYQKVIENVRLFRAILDTKIPVDDFDEVAVDINSYVEQLCSEAIQNTFM